MKPNVQDAQEVHVISINCVKCQREARSEDISVWFSCKPFFFFFYHFAQRTSDLKKVTTCLSHALSALPINANLVRARETDSLNSLWRHFFSPFTSLCSPRSTDDNSLLSDRTFENHKPCSAPSEKEHFLCHAANMLPVVNVWVWWRNRLKKKTTTVPIEFYFCVFFWEGRSCNLVPPSRAS